MNTQEIKAQDLRLGNWLCNQKKSQTTRELLTPHYVKVDLEILERLTGGDYCRWHYNYSPVKITPDILEKAGFELRPNQKPKSADGVVWGINNTTILYGLATDGKHYFFLDGYHNDVTIEYLHQLLNIYYILVGKELEITL